MYKVDATNDLRTAVTNALTTGHTLREILDVVTDEEGGTRVLQNRYDDGGRDYVIASYTGEDLGCSASKDGILCSLDKDHTVHVSSEVWYLGERTVLTWS